MVERQGDGPVQHVKRGAAVINAPPVDGILAAAAQHIDPGYDTLLYGLPSIVAENMVNENPRKSGEHT